MSRNAHYWNDEERNWMALYVPGHHHVEIAEEHNRLFPDIPVTPFQVRTYIRNHGLKTGFTGRFYKGQPAHNKGKKVPPEIKKKMERTMFKKGHASHNKAPIGTEVIATGGCVKVKVAEPNVWHWRTRMVWEAANGPRPEGYVFFHMNGDLTDDRLENIALVRKGDVSIANRKGLLTCDAELNEVVLNIARVTSAVTEAKKRQKK